MLIKSLFKAGQLDVVSLEAHHFLRFSAQQSVYRCIAQTTAQNPVECRRTAATLQVAKDGHLYIVSLHFFLNNAGNIIRTPFLSPSATITILDDFLLC